MTGVCQGASDSTHILKVESTRLTDGLDTECRWRERPTLFWACATEWMQMDQIGRRVGLRRNCALSYCILGIASYEDSHSDMPIRYPSKDLMIKLDMSVVGTFEKTVCLWNRMGCWRSIVSSHSTLGNPTVVQVWLQCTPKGGSGGRRWCSSSEAFRT